jgi:hypothetical protein
MCLCKRLLKVIRKTEETVAEKTIETTNDRIDNTDSHWPTWQQTATKWLDGLVRLDKECGYRKPGQRATWRSVMPLLCELIRQAFSELSVADRLRFAEIIAPLAKYKPPKGHHNDVERCASCGALADHAALRAAFNKHGRKPERSESVGKA